MSGYKLYGNYIKGNETDIQNFKAFQQWRLWRESQGIDPEILISREVSSICLLAIYTSSKIYCCLKDRLYNCGKKIIKNLPLLLKENILLF